MPQSVAKKPSRSSLERRKRALEEANRLSREQGCEPGWVIEEPLIEHLRGRGLSVDDLDIITRNNTDTGQHYIHFDETEPQPDPQAQAEKEGKWQKRMLWAGLAVAVAGVLVAVVGILIPLL